MTQGHTAKPINPSIYWLMGIAVSCLLGVVGLKVVFDGLQDELREKSANERARLFVGEEIVRGIHGIEKDLYLMAVTPNAAGVRRVTRSIESQLTKLRHDLDVLRQGGTVRREVLLNLEGRDEMVREATYHPDQTQERMVMELIEIAPLLDQVGSKVDGLEVLLLRGWAIQEEEDRARFFEWHGEVDTFLKHIPPFFARLDENANRLFFDSSARLRELEVQLQAQRDRLKKVEMGLVALVMILAGMSGMVFLRRINDANRKLEMALDEMRQAKEFAEQASRAKSEFVSRMSHELRTPLNAIIGFAQLLETEPLAPEHKEYVGLINTSGNHLLSLINAVLDHAKIEAGRLTLEKIAYDFPATIDAVRSIVLEQAESKGLRFTANISAELPRYVTGDPMRLRQILINLLTNAVKFTDQGSVELRVAVEDNQLVFSVRDTGIGMDAEALQRLFQPFSQADGSITRRFGGTGLGLMITRELVEAMGGKIEVESAPGVGSCFWVWLPFIAAEHPTDEIRDTLATDASLSAFITGEVLLVDDNRVNQQLAGAMLDRLGLPYQCADNGAEAVSRVASVDFSLVLMDMEMPEMDGVSATQAIRAAEQKQGRKPLPIIAMTANAMQEDRERCFAAGMNGYLSKPVGLTALESELRRLFAGQMPESFAAVAAPVSTAGGIYDRTAALAMTGDEELFEELAQLFVQDMPSYLAEVDEALAAADATRLARAAHTLKGLCATFVAKESESTARQLEQAARAGDFTACSALAPQVRAQTEALAAALTAK